MTIRLNKVTRDLNVGITTVVEFLQKKGYTIEASPNAKITEEQYAVLVKEFSTDKNLKIESEKFIQERQNKDRNKASISIDGFEKPKKEEIYFFLLLGSFSEVAVFPPMENPSTAAFLPLPSATTCSNT